jgi:type I restriction enzyme M protein
LPKGVFNPYTGINTNLLFFEKGKPTKEIWYYEMPYPKDIKNFSRSRPIDIKHFDDIKKWWKDRKENEFAWKVSIDEIKERKFNLDIKNTHVTEAKKVFTTEELLVKIDTSFQKSANLLSEIKKALL